MQFLRKLNIIFTLALIFLLVLSTVAMAEVYTVQRGDTLFSLSKKTGVPIEKIRAANGLQSYSLVAKQVLLVPQRYIVKSGDTLYLISKRFGIDLWELKSLNGLYSNNIFVGQALYVPQKSPYKRITVSRGDTLFLISRNYGVSVESIKQLNGLIGNTIYPGMKLLIPERQVQAPKRETQTTTSRGGYIDRGLIRSGSGVSYTSQDRVVLAKLIHAEAEGEPYSGKLGVGAVVVNRVKSSIFPNSIRGVIYQVDNLGLYQFSPVLDGRLDIAIPNAESYKACDEALAGKDPTGGALYFFNPSKITNSWLLSKPVIYRAGEHVFTN